jgi:hypothetical protein
MHCLVGLDNWALAPQHLARLSAACLPDRLPLQERRELQRRKQQEEEAAEARKRKVTFTIDLLGRWGARGRGALQGLAPPCAYLRDLA